MIESDTKIYSVPLINIYPDQDFNCRGPILPIDVVDLAKSIEETGLIQPVTICEYKEPFNGCQYKLIAGYRRYTAHKILKIENIDCIIRNDMQDDKKARLFNLSENIKRKDLNILQEALALKKLFELKVGRDIVAKKLGMSQGWVQVRFLLLSLPEEIQTEAAAGWINQTQIRELHSISLKYSKTKVFEMAKEIKGRKERGEKAISVNPNLTDPNVKIHRKRKSIFEMIEHIQNEIGSSIATRALAWAAGEISTNEFNDSLEVFAKEGNLTYRRQEYES